jgi:hypothetical protein
VPCGWGRGGGELEPIAPVDIIKRGFLNVYTEKQHQYWNIVSLYVPSRKRGFFTKNFAKKERF